jgi:hypothetical protein
MNMKYFIPLLFAILNLHVYAQTFGPDKTIFLDSTYEVREQYLSVAFNGWIYNGFNYRSAPYQGYRVLLSTDKGDNWTTLIDFSVPGASGWYPQIADMLVAGTDTSNLRVFLALEGSGAGGPENFAVVSAHNGISGIETGTVAQMGDFMTYRIMDIALASDCKYPMSSSMPYSVAVAYTSRDNSGIDSLNYFLSEDGGLTFDGPFWLDSTSGSFNLVDIAYGTGSGGSDGQFGIVAERNQHLSVLFSLPGSPTWFMPPLNVDSLFAYTNSICSAPEIAMQNSLSANLNGGFTTEIFAVADNPSNSTKDIVSFFLPQTTGTAWSMETVDISSDTSLMPALAYSEHAGGFFAATFYNSGAGELPFYTRSQEAGGAWVNMSYQYPDTLSFIDPYPAVCIGEDAGTEVMFSWKQFIDTNSIMDPVQAIKFDLANLTVGINEVFLSHGSFRVYPNPFHNRMTIVLPEASGEQEYQVEMLDVTQRIIYSEKISSSEGISVLQPGDIPTGIYFIRLTGNNEVLTRKVVAQ